MGESVPDVTESLLERPASQTQLDYLASDAIEDFLGQEKVACEWWALFVGWELRQLWTICGSSIIVSVLNFILILVTQMFVGHLGALELAGASIASIEFQGLAVMIMLGMGIAVQNQCSEAYEKKNYASLGIICQKSVVVHLVAAIIFSFLNWYSGTLLQAIGMLPSIADATQIFARGLIPQLFAFALSIPMQRFLQAQNISNPLVYIGVGVLFLHLFLTWLVLGFFNYGLLGAALTLSLSCWVLVIITGLYIAFSSTCEKTWTGLSINALKGLWSHAKLTLASMGMLSIEIYYTLLLVLSAGYLYNPDPVVSIDAFSICLNYWNWDFTFMLGLSAAATVRVCNELEGARPRVAKLSTMVVNGTGILISLVFIALIFASGTTLSKAFTSNDEVIKEVSSLTPLLAISILISGVEPILSGVAIGLGRPILVVCVYVVTYYTIGLTIAFCLAFLTNLGVAGMWWGLVAGFFLQSLFLIVLIVRTDWREEVGKACERLKKYAVEESIC